jgi:hypothetical protein
MPGFPYPLWFFRMRQIVTDLLQQFIFVAIDRDLFVWLEKLTQFIRVARAIKGTTHWCFEFSQVQRTAKRSTRVMPVIHLKDDETDTTRDVQLNHFIVGRRAVEVAWVLCGQSSPEIVISQFGRGSALHLRG